MTGRVWQECDGEGSLREYVHSPEKAVYQHPSLPYEKAPFRHSRHPLLVIPDVSNRESRVFSCRRFLH